MLTPNTFIEDLTYLKENFVVFEKNRSIIKTFKKNKNQYIENENSETFLFSLKDLLERFNKINSDLFIKFHRNEFLKNEKYYSIYVRYYNNLVLSKIKHFFFREKPAKPYVFLDNKFSSKDFLALLLKIKNESSIEENLTKYFLFFFFAFDFLYYKKPTGEKEGFFTDFAINKDVFYKNKKFIIDKIEDKIEEIYNNSQKEYNFRIWGNQIIAQILKINLYIAKNKPIDDSVLNLDTYEKLNSVYKDYVQYKKEKNKNFKIEPFSYFIGYEIWKNAHLLHRKADNNKNFIKNYLNYIENLFNEFEKVYKNEKLNYVSIYNLQINIIREIESLIDDFECIEKNFQLYLNNFSFLEIEKEQTLTKIEIDRNPESFSIEKLIEEENGIYKFNYLINNLFEKIIHTQIDKVALFSSYTSGAFLSILFSLYYPHKVKNIYLFKTFPFVDLQPYYYTKDNIRSNDIGKNCNILPDFKDEKNIIFVDDIMRTGFTYSMIRYAYYRVTQKDIEDKNMKYFVFFKNSKLKNMNFVESLYTSNTDFSNQIDDEIFIYNEKYKIKRLEDLKVNDKPIENEIKEYLTKYIFKDKKIDYSFILIKPPLVWFIIKEFIKIIENENKFKLTKNSRFYFYSFSPQGKTILLLLSYFLKNKYPDIKIFINKIKNINDNGYNIFVDITVNTGATAEIGLKMRNVIKDKKEMLNNINFLVVKNNSDLRFKKLYSIIG